MLRGASTSVTSENLEMLRSTNSLPFLPWFISIRNRKIGGLYWYQGPATRWYKLFHLLFPRHFSVQFDSLFHYSVSSSSTYNSHMSMVWTTIILQCVAVCCSVLQCIAVRCSVLPCVAVCCSVLQCVAVCCSVLQGVAVRCSVLQCVAVCCRVLQGVAVRTSGFDSSGRPPRSLFLSHTPTTPRFDHPNTSKYTCECILDESCHTYE